MLLGRIDPDIILITAMVHLNWDSCRVCFEYRGNQAAATKPGSGGMSKEDHKNRHIDLDDTAESDVVDTESGEPILVLIAHPQQRVLGRRQVLSTNQPVTVGRAQSCQLDFPDVPSMSREHARVGCDDNGVWVEDLGSTNGTYVNHVRIEGQRYLESGDRLQCGEVHFKFLRELDVEAAYFNTLHQLALQDGLTEIANKRRFDDELGREFSRARRYLRQLSLVLFDVDDLKVINDAHGHLTGDFVLQAIARIVRGHMRREEILARIGGDEFGILIPEVDAAGAKVVAERIRESIDEYEIKSDFISETLGVTCSFGIAELNPDMATSEELFTAADNALYDSKVAGRNRVTVSRDPENPSTP
jgi:diguanylate cyclase (GGDEF)-like protein